MGMKRSSSTPFAMWVTMTRFFSRSLYRKPLTLTHPMAVHAKRRLMSKETNLLVLLASTLETISRPWDQAVLDRLAEEIFPAPHRISHASFSSEGRSSERVPERP